MSDETVGRDPAAASEAPRERLEALTDEVLPALIARLRASQLGELEVRTGDWRVRLRRDASATMSGTVTAEHDPDRDSEPEELSVSAARSPAVGYFTPAPDLVIGRSVQAGDLLGTIDVLGIIQEVSAPADGIISRVLAEDGQAVEYGQALAEIDALEMGPPIEPGEAAVSEEEWA